MYLLKTAKIYDLLAKQQSRQTAIKKKNFSKCWLFSEKMAQMVCWYLISFFLKKNFNLLAFFFLKRSLEYLMEWNCLQKKWNHPTLKPSFALKSLLKRPVHRTFLNFLFFNLRICEFLFTTSFLKVIQITDSVVYTFLQITRGKRVPLTMFRL